jgi:hypothetical protein
MEMNVEVQRPAETLDQRHSLGSTGLLRETGFPHQVCGNRLGGGYCHTGAPIRETGSAQKIAL